MNFLRTVRTAVVRTVVAAAGAVAVVEVTTHLPSQGRSSSLYHTLADDYITPQLRRWLSPESAHTAAVLLAKQGLCPIHHETAVEQQCASHTTLTFGKDDHGDGAAQRVNVKPLVTPNPVGLAAGFDKDGEIIAPMLQLGFGFVEIGTVTKEPQPGNPAPRMFRLPRDGGIINRYGFNSVGAARVRENVEAFRHCTNAPKGDDDAHGDASRGSSGLVQAALRFLDPSPPARGATGAVGINLGKNKTSVTDEQVLDDYTSLIDKLGPYADYLVINISSPNTANLRDWQDAHQLRQLLSACLVARNKLETPVPPLFVKLAPDLSDEQLQDIATVLVEVGVDGVVVTNTTNQRPADLIEHHVAAKEAGGLSGKPVRDMATETIRKLYGYTEGSLVIIGVGGIASGRDAYDKLKAGASLVQVYSMLVYEGPGLVSRIRHELAELLRLNGEASVADVVGQDHEDLYWKKQRRQAAAAAGQLDVPEQMLQPPERFLGTNDNAKTNTTAVLDERTMPTTQ